MPPGRGIVGPFNQAAADVDDDQTADLAPCILKGTWLPGPEQRVFRKRLRSVFFSLFYPLPLSLSETNIEERHAYNGS